MKRSKMRNMQKRRAITGYLFISPFIIGFLAFMVKPLFESLWMSLHDVAVSTKGFTLSRFGIHNYTKALLVDPEYKGLLFDEVVQMIPLTIATIFFSFFVALLLNQKFKGRSFVRAIFFLPVILSSGVIVGLEFNNTLLQGMQEALQETSEAGVSAVLEDILKSTGVGSDILDVVFDLVDSVYDIAIASGIQIIIFLSGLQAVSPSMYEAATIEGCTAWESFWKITLPMVSPLILVNWIYTIIDFFIKTDNEVMQLISDTMIKRSDFGFGSAMAWIYFFVVIIFIGISTAIISRGVYYYE